MQHEKTKFFTLFWDAALQSGVALEVIFSILTYFETFFSGMSHAITLI